jgi:putative heme iron utilization protein
MTKKYPGTQAKKIDKNELKQALIEKPDTYLWELAEQCGCTATAVFYALKKLTITRKKRALPIPKSPKSNVKNIRIG